MKSLKISTPVDPLKGYEITDISRDRSHQIVLSLGTRYYQKAIIRHEVGDSQTQDTWHVDARRAGFGLVPMQHVGNFATQPLALAAAAAY